MTNPDQNPSPGGSVSSRIAGRLADGREVRSWRLESADGVVVEILEWGAIVRRWCVPAGGQNRNVVLGFDSLDGYLGEHPYFGAMAGPVAGRITEGRFPIGDKILDLASNDPPNHLHGADGGLDRVLWKGEGTEGSDGPELELTVTTPDDHAGYPGPVRHRVVYSLRPGRTLRIDTESAAEKPSPVSLTHHSYFNLDGVPDEKEHPGELSSILEHRLCIHAGEIFRGDEEMTVFPETRDVTGAAADFRRATRIGDAIDGLWQGHGDLYWLGCETESPREVASVTSSDGALTLSVSTDQSCLQFYTGAALSSDIVLAGGLPARPHAAFCLECEGFPNGHADSPFGSIVAEPGSPRRSRTEYAFTETT